MARLPSEYQEVEYIQTSGSEYINTNVIINSTNFDQLKYELDFMPLSKAPGNYWWSHGTGGNSTNSIYIGLDNGSSSISGEVPFTYGSGRGDITTSIKGKIGNRYKGILDFQNATYTIKDANDTELGTVSPITKSTPTGDGTLVLGRWWTNASSGGYGHSNRIYQCTISFDDVVTKQFIPCIRKTDLVVGLYETVNNIFYENNGEGELIAGPYVIYYRYLIRDGQKLYVTDNETLTELEETELSAELFLNKGSQIAPAGTILLNSTLSHPEILSWDSDYLKDVKLKVSAIPPIPQEIIAPIDASSISILGINSVTTVYTGTPLLAISRDNGSTWIEYNGTEWVSFTTGMTPTVFDAADWSWIPQQTFLVKIILNDTASAITSITFSYQNLE